MARRAALALAALVLVAVALFSGSVAAQTEESAELKARADSAMRELHYSEALELYDEAYAIDPNPALLYNRGRALEALTRFPEALEQLEEFVRKAPAELKAKVPNIDELIEEIRGKVSTLVVRARVRGARVLVRGLLVGTTPIAEALRVNSGDATIEVIAEGYHPFRTSTSLPARGELTVDANLVPKATTGVLVVTSDVAGAVVLVDGKRLGAVPAEARLERGRHVIVVRKDGYHEAKTEAVVTAGERKSVKIPLDAIGPITTKWWFWTGAAVAVAGGITLFIALNTERAPGSGDLDPGQVSGPLMRF